MAVTKPSSLSSFPTVLLVVSERHLANVFVAITETLYEGKECFHSQTMFVQLRTMINSVSAPMYRLLHPKLVCCITNGLFYHNILSEGTPKQLLCAYRGTIDEEEWLFADTSGLIRMHQLRSCQLAPLY